MNKNILITGIVSVVIIGGLAIANGGLLSGNLLNSSSAPATNLQPGVPDVQNGGILNDVNGDAQASGNALSAPQNNNNSDALNLGASAASAPMVKKTFTCTDFCSGEKRTKKLCTLKDLTVEKQDELDILREYRFYQEKCEKKPSPAQQCNDGETDVMCIASYL